MIRITVDGDTRCPSCRPMAQTLRCPHAGYWLAIAITAARCRSRDGAGHGALTGWPARARACQRRQVRSGMSSSSQNLEVDIPSSIWITSRSSKGPTGPRRSSSRRVAQAASPNASVRSSTWASSWASRVNRSDLPAARRSCLLRGRRPSSGRSTARRPSPFEPPRLATPRQPARSTRSWSWSPH